MIRILTLELLLFLLPFIVYAAWWFGTRRGHAVEDAEGVVKTIFTSTRSRWLALAGVVLVFTSIIFISLTTGHKPGGTYVAPHMVDGVLVPGHFIEEVEIDDEADNEVEEVPLP